jgi:hypothetical protein
MAGRLLKLLLLLVAFGAVTGFQASAALAAQPIEGRWNQFGGVIEYFATGPNTFGAREITANDQPCPNQDPDIRLTGSGSHYSGAVRYYFTSTCEFAGDGTIDITLSADGNSGHLVAQAPNGSTMEDTITRVPTALQGSGSELPGIVDGALLDLQARYHPLLHSRSKSKLRALGKLAAGFHKTVSRYHPLDHHDNQLKPCALTGLQQVVDGSKVKIERAGKGLTHLSHLCLKPDRAAGIVPSREPGGHHFVGSSAKVPRLEFDVTGGNVTNLVVVMATRCRGQGYAAASASSLMLDGTGAFGFSRDIQTGPDLAGSHIDVAGTVKGLAASGTARWTFDNPSDSPDAGVVCDSGKQPWSGR